ncbi:hypothetical protein QN277_002115 [Acacia crassicarpa]|uniref:Uncharacterized protein n=1 Tax=Acacia crassicarpa TaxID=499986 RepID=A0AAE1NA35_9FABA|nr:hypothetical protein QN277_002115 [Acacia crassicarpa]
MRKGNVLIHADNVELQQSSQHQDGINSGDYMNKSRSVQLSGLDSFQSSTSRRSFSKPRRKPSHSHVPLSVKSPQKQQPLMRTDRSPHYMKPTGSSGVKKDLFPVSLSNSQSDYDYKDQQTKFSNNWKASVVSGKQPAKTLRRKPSLKLSSTSKQNPSFKSSRSSPRKSCKIALCAIMNAQSYLSPERPMPNPQVSESERASVMKVCPYTFCSLNGHRRTPLPPLKSFLSERRSILKAQKTMKQEEPSLQRLKVPFKQKFLILSRLLLMEILHVTMQKLIFFIEIYDNGKEHDGKPTETGHGHETRKLESSEELQDQEVIKFMTEENTLAAREDNIKQIITNLSDESPELESNSKKDLKKYHDDSVTKADTMLSLHQEQNEESADENNQPSCSHEDTSTEICCRGIGFNDQEHLGSREMDDCDFEATSTEWKEKRLRTSKLEERVALTVLKEETEFKLEASPESLLEASVKSDKILSTTRLEEIKYLVEEAPQEAKAQKCACFEAQPHDAVLDLEATIESTETCSLIEEVFQNMTNAKDNGGQNETSLDNDVSCGTKVLDVGQKHICVKDGTPMPPSDQIYIASEEECKINQVERATDKGSKNQEMKNTDIYQDFTKQVENNGYGRQVHEISELHKIDETNPSKDSRLETDGGSISHVHSENIFTAQDKEMLEAIESGASCMGTEEKKRSKNWRGEMKHKIPVNDEEQLRQFNTSTNESQTFCPWSQIQNGKRLFSNIRLWMKEKVQSNGCLIMHLGKQSPNLLQ